MTSKGRKIGKKIRLKKTKADKRKSGKGSGATLLEILVIFGEKTRQGFSHKKQG